MENGICLPEEVILLYRIDRNNYIDRFGGMDVPVSCAYKSAFFFTSIVRGRQYRLCKAQRV
jgi:hypothetical protein